MRISDWSSDVCSSDLDGKTGTPVPVLLRQATPEMFRGEVEADGNCQFDIGFSRPAKGGGTMRETCRTFLTCEDVPEVGCRSEFERLIKANRRQLETFDAPDVIPVTRAVRSSRPDVRKGKG